MKLSPESSNTKQNKSTNIISGDSSDHLSSDESSTIVEDATVEKYEADNRDSDVLNLRKLGFFRL